METFMSPLINPPADAIALDGLGRAARYIVEATVKPSSRVARWNMMMAAMEGAMAFQKGLGAVHALSHPLGALQSSPHHGTLNAILLPAVLRFNRLSVPEKLKRMGEVLGLDEGADLPNFVSMLNNQLGLPRGLGDLGIERRILPRIAELACQDHCHVTNPRVASIADYLEILEQSY
jgi:alcohol dehydrogenase class IV